MYPMAYVADAKIAQYQFMNDTSNYEDPHFPVYVVAGASEDNPGLLSTSLQSYLYWLLLPVDSSLIID
jgi:hypothetical protein